jgi:hypothetical protein
MELLQKWESEYQKQKKIISDYKKLMKPHQKAMTHARLMRNQYKKIQSQVI